MTEWMIKGFEVVNCNCNTGCPCQFMSLPSHGDCRAAVAIHIDRGHHGKVKLDGLNMAFTCAWPGAVHQGHGEIQYIIDERASAEQRTALHRILKGDDTEPGASFFKVYSSMCDKVHEPIYKPIEIAADMESREGRVSIPGIVETVTTAIRNPVTGAAHRARVNLPHGFEYDVAEYAKGTSTSAGPIKIAFKDSHAHLGAVHMTGTGVVH